MGRQGLLGHRGGGQAQPHALDAARIGVDHLELGTRGMGDHLALRRQMARQHEDQPAQGVDLFLVDAADQLDADLGLDPSGVGLDAAWTRVVEAAPRPPKQAGRVVEDPEQGAAAVVETAWFSCASDRCVRIDSRERSFRSDFQFAAAGCGCASERKRRFSKRRL